MLVIFDFYIALQAPPCKVNSRERNPLSLPLKACPAYGFLSSVSISCITFERFESNSLKSSSTALVIWTILFLFPIIQKFPYVSCVSRFKFFIRIFT